MTEQDFTTTHFVRKPFYVDGVRVTKENMESIALWCNGVIKVTEPKVPGKKPSPFIEVEVHRPANERQKRAFVGDWVLKAENGFKIYTNTTLQSTFEVVETETALNKLKEKFQR